jgi:hypothetical protein
MIEPGTLFFARLYFSVKGERDLWSLKTSFFKKGAGFFISPNISFLLTFSLLKVKNKKNSLT